jgi:hypothetical protein
MAADTTYQSKVYRKNGGEELVVADGGIIRVESGGSIIAESGSVMTLPDIALEVGDLALADAKIIVGNAAGKAAAVTPSGDVKIDNTGAMTIQAKAVKNTMIAAAAGTVLVGTKTSGDVTALDISAEGAMALGQGGGETPAAYAMSGDVTMTKGGVTAIGAGKVTSAMLANGAGVAALLSAGLGGSATIIRSETGAKTIVAANNLKDRACIVVAVVTEAFATGDASRTIVTVGEADTADKCWAATTFPDGLALGTVLVGAFTNLATKAITVTSTAAEGTGTGGVAVTVIAIPTT